MKSLPPAPLLNFGVRRRKAHGWRRLTVVTNSAQTCGRQTRRFGMKLVVIGGSGLIGTKLVKNLRQHGHEVVAASPSSGVTTLTGEGLAEALTDVEGVVVEANAASLGE